MQAIQVDQVVKQDGMRLIRDIVCSNSDYHIGLSVLPDSITGGRERINQHGKLSKRIRRNLRRDLDITLPTSAVEEIGNVMNENSLSAREYLVEFTRDLNDTVGNYGDQHSCFKDGGEFHYNLLQMIDSGMFSAFRVCKPEGRKLARTWVYHDPHDGAKVLFNAYGLLIDKQAMLAGKLLEIEPRACQLRGDLSINNPFCYALGGTKDTYNIRDLPDPQAYQDDEHYEDEYW